MWLMNRIVNIFLKNSNDAPNIVLEVGLGVGRAARCFSNRKIRYVGVEPTQSLRMAAEENLADVSRDVSIHDLDFSSLSLLNEKFDHTFAIHVLEHASNPLEARSWLSSMKNQTKNEGFISIACPNYFSYGKYFYDGDWTHAYPTTPNRLKAIGDDLGLKLIRCEDTRATFSNPVLRLILLVINFFLNTKILNEIGKKLFGVEYLGTGIKVALFWKLSIVTFQKVD
jgi:hypothetical protein